MLWWILGITAILLTVSGVTLALLVRRNAGRALQQAWPLIETQPGVALTRFTQVAKKCQQQYDQAQRKKKPASATLVPSLQQARVGEALCLQKLARLEEAATAEAAARKLGSLSPEFVARLCAAWLATNPVRWPEVARQDLVEYLALPDTAQQVELRQQAIDTTIRLLELPVKPTEDEIDEIVAFGNQVVAAAPALDEAHYRLGLALYHSGCFPEACQYLEHAAQAAPENAERHLAWARAQWDSGDKAASRTTYLATYRLQRDAETAYAVGRACFQTSDIPFSEADGPEVSGRQPLASAARFFEDATTREPQWLEAWLSRAEAELQLDEYAAAAESASRALELEPRNVQAEAVIGRCRLLAGDVGQAKQSLALLREQNPDSPGTWRLAGDIAFQEGDYVRALPEYRKLVTADADPEVIFRTAKCELEAGDPHQSRKLLQDRPYLDADARLTLGRSLARTGQWAEALKVLNAEQGRFSSEYAYYTAHVLGANQRYREATRIFEQLVDHPKWGALSRRALAHVALSSGDFETAEKLYQAAEDESVREFDLGRLAVIRGDIDRAERHFQQAAPVGADKQPIPAYRITGRQLRFARAYVSARQGDSSVVDDFEGDQDALPYLQEVIAHCEYEAGRHKQSLPLFEQSIRQRESVPTSMLSRLASGYLHQQRYREALPHLVAVAQRRPEERAVSENLAFCRFNLAREHYRQQRWEAALLEFEAARDMLRQLDAPQATGVILWEAECRFRAGVQALTSTRLKQFKRAIELFHEGTVANANEGRMWFGLALGRAAQNEFGPSATAGNKAAELQSDHVGIGLAHGLSLQAAGRSVEARAAFERTLKLLASRDRSQPRVQFLELATRFALGLSFAKDQEWSAAAEALRPLLQHPLLQKPGTKITTKDVAKSVVAYLALAGKRPAASEIAKQYLKGETLGEVLIAVVQAEAGDYAGAADTLEKVITPKSERKMVELLIGCWLSAAADKVKKNEFPSAETYLEKVLGRSPQHGLAKRLQDALKFAERFKNFDPKSLDNAIANCQQLVAETKSAQLVRTLGVLMHRKALQGNGMSATDRVWNDCYEYWSGRIMRDHSFWKQFLEEYNTGKGKRERVKDEELAEWRKVLPEDLAKEHQELAIAAIRDRQKTPALLHLKMIWQWKADHKFELNQLTQALGQALDESLISFLSSMLSEGTDQHVRKFLEPVASQQYVAKALEHLTRMKNARDEAVAMMNAAGAGNTYAAQRARTLLGQARDEARQALNYAEKARRAAPGNADIEGVYKVCQDVFNDLNSVCRQIGV